MDTTAPHRSRAAFITTLLAATAAAMLATGCAPAPDRTAGIWLWPGESMTLQATAAPDGAPPKVRIYNQGPGPLGAIVWARPDGTTTFGGLPVGADLVLTVSTEDTLRMADGGGSRLQIDMWSATNYTLENAPPVGTLRGLTNDQLRDALVSR